MVPKVVRDFSDHNPLIRFNNEQVKPSTSFRYELFLGEGG
jgi:hypothetical protein